MTSSQRLLARLRSELGLDIPESARIRRTNAGRVQRSEGAWTWFVEYDGDTYRGRPDIGSHYPVTTLLGFRRLVVSDDMDMGHPTGQSMSIDFVDPELGPPSPDTYGLVAITPELNAV